ncbi:16S rRNA (adenine(1518)-N(6)/adenine(1519)-N(6))-dimethyltransferase RsmA [Isoptericola sp. b441]|uniref:Ribosomal RNA small subunit methyltransferase A n=1 Tax=Actinotalea lenta TaxID=3064654 RepID=A0ABT9D7G2_9CELL|nr:MULTISPECIES: 16S rRNA (adenine(1518)-N(6)/adenine(1519)-N(6))-dimethyltransferase RsmA [unclassified Isoptericola]MDO8106787.1 16S rRNA (adenine(1518)-N(6)/adenine(1519)-N(6))-dimethyltransferase RsmA [Isoptericola sp. b441]MDO8121502.1 16S rRNA (adenine(1518)-N(6)/adenine(1519)-N(6))-dimethyltransferase RsmA [Isoptericola sp. b490]
MTDPLLGPSAVRALAASIGARPTKTLGQNFVVDPGTVRRIVRTARVAPGERVVEVGPGLGSLTLGLLEAGASVVAVEIDPVLATRLPATVAERLPEAADRLTVVGADALRVTELPGAPPTALVANLPYNVAVPVLLAFLERFSTLRRGLVMVQAEVADRLVAGPGSRTYGVPSVKTAWYAHARPAGVVGRATFWPVPRVDSALVAWDRHEPPPGDRDQVFALVDAAFAQRRKMLRAALADAAGSGAVASAALTAAGVDPTERGERLGVEQFAAVARALADAGVVVASRRPRS